MKITDISWWMSLPYEITIHPLDEKNDGIGGYTAWVEDLGRYSCCGWGKTVQEAVNMVDAIKEDIFRRCIAEDFDIPLPTDNRVRYSSDSPGERRKKIRVKLKRLFDRCKN